MKQTIKPLNIFVSLRLSYIYIGFVSIFINLLMLTGPLYMLQVYDRILASGSVSTLVVISALAGGLYVFYGILEALRGRILARLGQRVDAQLSATTYALSSDLPNVLGAKASQLRPVKDLDILRQFLSGAGPAAIFDIPWMPIYLAIVFLFHPILGFVTLGGGVFICILIGLKEIVSRKPTRDFSRDTTHRARLVENSRSNAEVIRAMGMMGHLQAQWQRNNDSYLSKQSVTNDISALFGTIVKSFRFLLQSAILGMGAWLAIQQEVSPGIMIAASIMTSRALAPIEQAVAHWSGFIAARQAKKRLVDVIGQVPNTNKTIMELPLPDASLNIDSLACGPAGLKQAVVQGASFDLKAGEGLGIIGPSGSGKSTLARAIVGITPSLRGAIRFDSAELAQWDQNKIGQFIGYLPQNIQLFDGTISDNIARFAPDANPDAVIEAARLADVHELITALPDGYNTVIGTSGFALSAGQQQRIALARALYAKPFLVVLDEPNSNLDAEGEAALTNAIKAMKASGSIVVVIAHRPSAIAAVDKILCLKDGKQAAFGPREDVLKQVVAPVQPQRAV